VFVLNVQDKKRKTPKKNLRVLNIVLVEPEIPPNTGNIARICAAAGLRLHLVHPLGFKTDDRHLKRAGLDYWGLVDITHYQSIREFLGLHRKMTMLAFSTKGQHPYTAAPFAKGCYLLFGSETSGLPTWLLHMLPTYHIPMTGQVRSLNLATSVGIVAYEALRQINNW
jgi:tRNA (cytidine/uridine-2'-O-)-methyltransferase